MIEDTLLLGVVLFWSAIILFHVDKNGLDPDVPLIFLSEIALILFALLKLYLEIGDGFSVVSCFTVVREIFSGVDGGPDVAKWNEPEINNADFNGYSTI